MQRRLSRFLLLAPPILVVLPAAALVTLPSQSFLGNVPEGLYDGEPCFPDTIDVQYDAVADIQEVRVNVSGVEADGDPNTWVKCDDFGNGTFSCMAGFADGTIASCYDIYGPSELPRPGDRLYLLIDPDASIYCDAVVEHAAGEDNPACRASGSGGTSGGTGGTSGTVCDESNYVAELATAQSTVIPSDACVKLKVDPTWSLVDPRVESLSATVSYPVPFTASSCAGDSAGDFTGNHDLVHLIDGEGWVENYECDIYLQLQGEGSSVEFTYYN